MKIKSTNTYKHLRVYYIYYITNVVNLIPQKVQETMKKYKILSFKIYGLKYVLKYRMEITRFMPKFRE